MTPDEAERGRLLVVSQGPPALALRLPPRGMPEILAFGDYWEADAPSGPVERSSRVNGMDRAVPSAVLLPTGGMGFFGWPAIAGHRDGAHFTIQFAGWDTASGEGRTVLSARDAVARLSLRITIEATPAGLLSMRTALANEGDTPYSLDRCMAATVLLDAGPAKLTALTGMWGREFGIGEEELGRSVWLQESRRGRTSHDRFPGLFVSVNDTVTGLHLGWSGNHLIAVDRLDDGRRLLHAGELFEPGEMRLAPGETYESPVAFFTAGWPLEDVSRSFRHFVGRELIAWPDERLRPVTLNTWEGTYFDHRPDVLIAQAEAAQELGIERFVLDDGWFRGRNDDTTSLGDWFVDERKYPDGLAPLAGRVRELGMAFGLWVEPEMTNPDSDLFRAHPDWALQVQGRPLLTSRNQLVLDLTRREVSEYLFARLDAVLSELPIDYLKWDMNRDLTHPGDAGGRAATARQTRAAYALMDRIRAAHPSVEIESCASGGGRADYGVLARTHRIWTSDGTDALERLEIQRGARLFFPPEILGAHISASPNHQTGRRHSLSFRAVVALAYHFGIELDPLKLTDAERGELASWIALHKRLRPLLHGGEQFHLAPLDGRYVWGAADEAQVALFVAQGPQMRAEQPAPVALPLGPIEDGAWRVAACHPARPDFIRVSEAQKALLAGETPVNAHALRRAGLNLPMLRPESGMVIELARIGKGEKNG